MKGHKFKVVGLVIVPYTNYRRDFPGSKNPVIPLESLDFSMLHTLAAKLNFTYEMRPPMVEEFGLPRADGNWTGTVGTLQHQQADFSLILSPTSERLPVVDFSRVYTPVSVCIVSLKPGSLPQYFQLVRPFTGELWLAILVSVAGWALTLWLLGMAWSTWGPEQSSITLSNAFLYSWGTLLQGQSIYNLRHSAERVGCDPSKAVAWYDVLVGWWLVFCLVIIAVYSSSLVAHLTVQSMLPAINSFQDLLDQDGWTWGLSSSAGTINIYFNTSPDDAIKEVNKRLKTQTQEDGMRDVLRGHHSLMIDVNIATILIASRYTDSQGYTPFYISTTKYPIFAGNAWGFRRGAPFRRRFDLMTQKMIETGLLDLWLRQSMAATVASYKRRYQHLPKFNSSVVSRSQGQEVLNIHHLQGVFYLLLLGYGLACLALLQENAIHFYKGESSHVE
ncbi:probable glutamate receptor [Procambarus clarkii]|uniref:probable glutamate receptor n=1 Tax=Procambarus clarkii TaxID=6728 RepID=UPI0037431918